MISSVFELKESQCIPDYLIPVKETKLEQNYFNSSLDFIMECNKELLDVKRDFYKLVLENSENEYLINESYIDILNTLKKIIKKILAYLESLIRRFATALSKFAESDKYILRKKNEIKKFPKDKTFKIEGYNYTIDENIPIVDVVDLDIEEIELTISDDSTPLSKIDKLTSISNKISNETFMNDIRAQILNIQRPVSETEFGNAVFAIFRDNKSSTSDIIIDKKYVDNALREYENYKSKIKNVEKLQTNIEVKYKSFETRINRIIKESRTLKFSDENEMSESETLKSILTKLISACINQIQRVANLHIQAMAAKMDAYNALTIQDREVLYKALDIVQRDISNTFVMRESSIYDDYTRELYYRNYVLEKYFMNKEQERFVDECLALSESDIPQLKTIHEDLKMDVKGKFEKFKALIQQIFNKFSEKIKSFFDRDKKFLTENKDVILNKQIPEYTLNNMPQYSLGIKNLQNTNLPVKSDIDKLVSLSEEEVKKSILPAYDGKSEFNEFAVRFFLCNNSENKDRSSSDKEEVNMQNIYNFCTNDSILKIIQNDTKNYNNEVNKVQSKVLNGMSESFTFNEYGAKYLYSTVLETFINEDDASDKSSGGVEINANNQSSSDQNAKSGAQLNLNTNKEDKKDDNKPEDNAKETNNDNKDNTKETNNKKLQETADWYLKYLRIANAAKMTAYQKIYTEYMKIIRYHISVVNGKASGGEENQEEIRKTLKDYLKADKDSKESAANRVIAALKKIGKNIDRHDVDTLANQNKSKLEE